MNLKRTQDLVKFLNATAETDSVGQICTLLKESIALLKSKIIIIIKK